MRVYGGICLSAASVVATLTCIVTLTSRTVAAAALTGRSSSPVSLCSKRNAFHHPLERFPLTRGQSVRIVSPALFDQGTLQTPGSARRSAIAADKGIATRLWGWNIYG